MGSARATLAVLLAASIAHANGDPKQTARQAIAHAKELHKAGKFREALDELMRAYALDPRKDLLYGIAQLHVKLLDCPQAITFFRRYLAAKPDAAPAEKARQGILACEGQPAVKPPPSLADPPPPDRAPPPPPPVDKLTPSALQVRRGPSPWYTDTLGDALVGGGVIVGTIGLVEYLAARSAFSDAGTATTYQDRVDGYADARSKRTIAAVLGAGGFALGVAGIVRYATRGHVDDRVAVIVDPDGGGFVTWTGAW